MPTKVVAVLLPNTSKCHWPSFLGGLRFCEDHLFVHFKQLSGNINTTDPFYSLNVIAHCVKCGTFVYETGVCRCFALPLFASTLEHLFGL